MGSRGIVFDETNVVVGDVVEEEAASPAQERPVNGRGCAAEERPLLLAVVGDGGVRVVEVGEHHNPVVGELS